MKNQLIGLLFLCFYSSCLEAPSDIVIETNPYTEDYEKTFAEVSVVDFELYATNGKRVFFQINVNPDAFEDMKNVNFIDPNNVELVIEVLQTRPNFTPFLKTTFYIDAVDIENDFEQMIDKAFYSLDSGLEFCFNIYYRHNVFWTNSPSSSLMKRQKTPGQTGSCQILEF
jgi:hypothetical protein